MNIADVFTIIGFAFFALKIGVFNSNACPVGVATTDPDLQKALVIDEKKYRTANYLISMRKGLFRIAAAAGLDSPVQFSSEHIVYKDEKGKVWSLQDIYQTMVQTAE